MYKKKKIKIITAVIMTVIVMLYIAGNYLISIKKSASQAEPESEMVLEEHNVLMYKTADGSVEFDSSYLKSESDSEALLSIRAETLVTLQVVPKTGKLLQSVDIVDYDFNEVNNFLRTDNASDVTRVNFVMPDNDIIINFNFENEEMPETEPEMTTITEAESEPETEEGNPYGLKLHGLTVEIINSYDGKFDDKKFLEELGSALRIDSPRSDYKDVTDVTFADKDYEGETEENKVSHYIYFNNDRERIMLATYYMDEDAYIFSEILGEEETETQTVSESEAAMQRGASGNTGGNYTATGGNQEQQINVSTSFDIMQVSTVFLAFVGSEDDFYQEVFEYVLDAGLTGTIVGTMSGYEINPEKQKAAFSISLNQGGTIKGTYNKNKNKYSFSGM